MYQLQYNRRSFTSGKDWKPMPTYGNTVQSKGEAEKLKRAYHREFLRIFGYRSDLQLRIAAV